MACTLGNNYYYVPISIEHLPFASCPLCSLSHVSFWGISDVSFWGISDPCIKGRIPLVPSYSADCLLFLVGFKILFFWYCLPELVGLEGLPNLLLLQLEGFAGFERILVLMCFFVTTWLESLVFKSEPTKPSEIGRPILLEMENFACEVHWFQNSAVVY